MRRKIQIGIVGAFIVSTLLPMWAVALNSPSPVEEIQIDQSVTQIRPLQEFVSTPNELMPSEVGVIVWIALFVLIGVIVAVHRFMNRAVRPPETEESAPTGDEATFPWLETENRWLTEYHPPSGDVTGLVVMGSMTVLAIVFAALFTAEYLTLARTQYFGVYLAGMMLSLAGSTVAYYAWFMPHVKVAEQRGFES